MGALVLGVILITGYIFILSHPKERYQSKRVEGYKLYFRAGIWGVGFTLAAGLVSLLFDLLDIPSLLLSNYDIKLSDFNSNTLEFTDLKKITFLIATFAFSLVPSLASYIWFGILNKEAKLNALLSVVRHHPFERLLMEATMKMHPISLTLDSGKVYVGLITDQPAIEHGQLEYIRLLPLLSGWRCSEKKLITFTTNYYQHYENVIDLETNEPLRDNHLTLDDFEIVVPEREISSLGRFDLDTYKQFRSNSDRVDDDFFNKETPTYTVSEDNSEPGIYSGQPSK